MNITEKFTQDGYVNLIDFLPLHSCEELTDELKKLVNEQKTEKDIQCPKSEAVHGANAFDKLLEYCLPYFEKASGLELYPTYSYARLYSHDEELVIHKDRESCEISATITLGFNDKCWSIFMGDHSDKSDGVEIVMNVGDAVLYRGMDKYHWRNKFEGQWQAQVFLHYVDKNGPHAEWKYDKRESLGVSRTKVEKSSRLDFCYSALNAVTDGFCENIIKQYSPKEVEKEAPYIGSGQVDTNIRNVQRLMLPMNQGIGATLTSMALNLNYEYWQYAVTHSNQTEFLMYEEGGKYEAHVDTEHKHSNTTRKLTAIAILNDDFEGGKFFLQVANEKLYPPQQKGTIIVFPSYILHGVEPVTKGIRYAVVTWLVGPYFK
jgi:alkylated DNA repair dioxygenase AlkB